MVSHRTFEQNYDRILKLIPNLLNLNTGSYLKYKANGFMDLNIDILEVNAKYIRLSMAHNKIQNGDVMADPDMEIKVWKHGMAEAMTFQNDYLGIFQQVYIENEKYYPKLKVQLNSFLRTWLLNIRKQKFILSKTKD